MRRCRQCGCTEVTACTVASVPCCWVEDDLCSACAVQPFLRSAVGLHWLELAMVRMLDDLRRNKWPQIVRCGKGKHKKGA